MTSTTTDVGVALRTAQTTAVAGLAIAGVIIFAGNYHVTEGENGGAGAAVITGLGCLLVTAVLYGAVLPRTRNSSRAAVILGILAVLSLAAFWSGITPVLTGAALATTSSTADISRGARIAQAAGGAGTIGALAVTLASSHLF